MNYDDFRTLCEQRHSVRYFDDEPLTDDEILKLLKVAELAPNVENLQPWHFHIVRNAELRRTLAKASCYGDFIEGASVFIVVTCDLAAQVRAKDAVWNPHELEYSCMAAMEHVLLGASAMGIGSCWVSLHHGAVHEALKLQNTVKVVGGIMLGRYRKGEEKNSQTRERKPFERIYTFHI